MCNTDGNNNASSSVISKDSENGKGNDSNQCTLPPVVNSFPDCISETVRCRKFILGRDIGWGGVGVQRHGLTLI